MEVAAEVRKIIDFTTYVTVQFFALGGGVSEVAVNQASYQGCQF